MSVIKKETIDVRRIGTALIGGDFTGNARGDHAIDIQTGRTGAAQIASSDDAIAIGRNVTASGIYGAIGIGKDVTASGSGAIAIGRGATASGDYYPLAIGRLATASSYYCIAIGKGALASATLAIAIGETSVASAYRTIAIGIEAEANANEAIAVGYGALGAALQTIAIGYDATARIQRTVNISGVIINKRDDNGIWEHYAGVEVVLLSEEVDMKVVADQTLTFPANCKFWLDEIGIIARTITDLVAQPTVRYGITGDLDKHNAAAITTALTAADKREIETPLVPSDGETSLTAGVTIAANATTFTGRFYWRGMFVEDE